MLSIISLVSLVLISTSRGKICEYAGTSKTSSNVKPSPKNLLDLEDFDCGALMIVAMCKDRAGAKFTQMKFIPSAIDNKSGGEKWKCLSFNVYPAPEDHREDEEHRVTRFRSLWISLALALRGQFFN